MRTGLRGHITALMPREIILPKGKLTSTTSKVLRASLRNPRQHQLAAGSGCWDAAQTLQEVEQCGYFAASQGHQGGLPPALQVYMLPMLALFCCMHLVQRYSHRSALASCIQTNAVWRLTMMSDSASVMSP